MDIVACFDKGYVMPTSVMMFSVCDNNRDEDIIFHLVVDESVSSDAKNRLKELIHDFPRVRIEFYLINSDLTKKFSFEHGDRLTRSTYYRLFLAEILPESIKKVIYLDGDCIIRNSLRSLWNTDITGYAIAAAFDACEGMIEFYNRLHYPSYMGYFNAGVLLINLDYWRQHHISKAFVEYCNVHSDRIKLEDQDVLNAVLKDCKLSIPVKYNFQTLFFKEIHLWDENTHGVEFMEALYDPTIVHFSSKSKPWDAYIRYSHPYSNTFYKYQNQTMWKGSRVERRSRKTRIKNSIGDNLRRVKILTLKKSGFINISQID